MTSHTDTIPINASDLEIARHVVSLYWFFYKNEDQDPPFGQGLLCSEGEKAAEEIATLIRILRFSTHGLKPSRHKAVLARNLQLLCTCWLTVTGEVPEGYFPEPEIGGRPAPHSAAGFCYIMLSAVGCQFSDREFKDQFAESRAKVLRNKSKLQALFGA